MIARVLSVLILTNEGLFGISQVNDVEFYLFTRNISNKYLRLSDHDDSIISGVQIKFIIHGWGESRARPYYHQMTGEYLRRGDYNVVHVDWSKPARAPYRSAVRNTIPVGKSIAKFILGMSRNNGVPLGMLHLLGHSLGAHVAGIAGKQVGGKIGRITGLDPAGPLYEDVPNIDDRKLSKEDARMVDVIHTDGGVFGYRKPMGSVDFFPNGGIGLQPGCLLGGQNGGSTFNNSLALIFCSHTRSHQYYIRSINAKIEAKKCDSWAEFRWGICRYQDTVFFGEDTPPSAIGKYYFRIN